MKVRNHIILPLLAVAFMAATSFGVNLLFPLLRQNQRIGPVIIAAA